MPRRKRPNLLNSNTDEPRRGKRQRVAKQRPDFVDPFSLGKKKTSSSEAETSSPTSHVTLEDSTPGTDQVTIQAGTKKCQLCPPKKRASLRETWAETLLPQSEQEISTPLLPPAKRESIGRPHTRASKKRKHLKSPRKETPKQTSLPPIKIKIPLHLTRPEKESM